MTVCTCFHSFFSFLSVYVLKYHKSLQSFDNNELLDEGDRRWFFRYFFVYFYRRFSISHFKSIFFHFSVCYLRWWLIFACACVRACVFVPFCSPRLFTQKSFTWTAPHHFNFHFISCAQNGDSCVLTFIRVGTRKKKYIESTHNEKNAGRKTERNEKNLFDKLQFSLYVILCI